jgi:hypothetical protein
MPASVTRERIGNVATHVAPTGNLLLAAASGISPCAWRTLQFDLDIHAEKT